MNVFTEFIPRVQVQEHKTDKSFSHTGTADFTKAEPEIKTFVPRPVSQRPRSRKSEINSYT